MEVVVQALHADAQTLREDVVRRLRFATQRASGFVSRAVVRMKDTNGPRGGVDKQCQVHLTTTDGTVIVALSQGVSWRAALELALSRAVRALWRRIGSRKAKAVARSAATAA